MSMALGRDVQLSKLRIYTDLGTHQHNYSGYDVMESMATKLAQAPCMLQGLRTGV